MIQRLKQITKSILSYPRDYARSKADKTPVFVVCSMRSGSTLLKALLATRPDVSHLPETNFQVIKTEFGYKKLTKQPIVVLKHPRSYGELDYPSFPSYTHKVIVLSRDVGPTVNSLLKMNQAANYEASNWNELSLAKTYWVNTYQSIMERVDISAKHVFFVRYEDLLQDPIRITSKLFSFIGSSDQNGTDRYQKPSKYQWQWYKDDGGETIKSLQVQPQKPIQLSKALQGLIQTDASIIELRKQLGYIH